MIDDAGSSPFALHVNDVSSVGTNLVRGLQACGWRAELLQPAVRAAHGTPERRRSWRQNQAYFLADRVSVAVRLRRGRPDPDVLHIHYGMFGAIGLIANRDFVLHFHGGDLTIDDRRRSRHLLHRAAAGRAALCLVSTPDLLAYGPRVGRELTFLPNPVETNVADVAAGTGRGVLFSAKLDRNKGGGVFLPAARRLAEAGAGVTVLGFGSSSRDHHAELARLDAAGATIVAERLPRSVFQRMLGEAAVVVGQFRVGALGMTELDALALQRPVVTGFRFPDAYKEPPPVVDASSAEQITDEVLGLLERHEDREALGLEGRRWVIRHHGTRRVAEQLIALYRESLAPNTRR